MSRPWGKWQGIEIQNSNCMLVDTTGLTGQKPSTSYEMGKLLSQVLAHYPARNYVESHKTMPSHRQNACNGQTPAKAGQTPAKGIREGNPPPSAALINRICTVTQMRSPRVSFQTWTGPGQWMRYPHTILCVRSTGFGRPGAFRTSPARFTTKFAPKISSGRNF